ncbi:RL4A [Hepatospora eriocheir]|uniref:RL4A n=1 Tax=Hepatospora eriocheir TaxID=1081669 RepID=A0A1X0QFG8_9MICR|nr:RL4A [Hepatospora eriocheir]
MGITASANPAIVEGRGHRIENIKSFPIVVDDSISTITKTKDALKLLVNLGLGDDLKKVKDSKTITSGKGKWRNRKYTERVGLLLVHDGETEMKAFSNITGVELAKVDSLNLLTLCSGGRLGRLIVYTKSAFMKLSTIYSDEGKKGFSLPDNMISIDNLDEYFYSPEIQSLINVPSLLPKGTTKKSKEELEKINEMIEMF